MTNTNGHFNGAMHENILGNERSFGNDRGNVLSDPALFAGGVPPAEHVQRNFELIVNQITSMQREMFNRLLDPRRDLDKECGFPKTVDANQYWELYNNDAIAARVCEVLPRHVWQVQPEVYEDEDAETQTPFELAWDDLCSGLRPERSFYQDEKGNPVWNCLARADILSGVGQYGVILLGFDDGLDLSEPVKGVEELYSMPAKVKKKPKPTQTEDGPTAVSDPNDPAPNAPPTVPNVKDEIEKRAAKKQKPVGNRRYVLNWNADPNRPRGKFDLTKNAYQAPIIQVKDVSNEMVVMACNWAKNDDRNVTTLLQDMVPGASVKVCDRAIERAMQKGYVDYGTSIRSAFLTKEGEELLATVNAYRGPPPNTYVGKGADEYGFPDNTGERDKAAIDLSKDEEDADDLFPDSDAIDVDGAVDEEGNPVEGMEEEFTPRNRLVYLRAFPEAMAQISLYETNPTSPRYCQPVTYLISFNDSRDQPWGSNAPPMTNRLVHWTRVIHVVLDGQSSSEIFGQEKMRQVYRNILSLQKLYYGSAEMYWKGAFPGISFESHPQLGGQVSFDKTALRSSMEQMMNGLQRYMISSGGAAKMLSPTVVDPTQQIEVQIGAICVRIGIPIPVFKGYEIGEQASENNDKAWEAVKVQSRNEVRTPKLIAPLVDRLINTGALPEPVGYSVRWAEGGIQSETEKSQVALTYTQAMVAYISGNCATLMPPMEYLTRVWKLTEEEATAIVEAAERVVEEQKAEQEQMMMDQIDMQEDQLDRGLIADPNDPELVPDTAPGGAPPFGGGPPKPPGAGGAGGGFPPKGPPKPPALNAFCPTGEGGGIDPSCSSGDGGEDYRMGHRPSPDGPRAHDLLEGGMAPDDIYKNPQFYVGDPRAKSVKETITALRKIQGNPNAEITIYRASPKNELRSGDWVSLSKSYSAQHGMADDPSEDVPVHAFKVKASEIRWAGDDLHEFGYFPETKDKLIQNSKPGQPVNGAPKKPAFGQTANSNPKGCNQFTGKGCATGGTLTHTDRQGNVEEVEFRGTHSHAETGEKVARVIFRPKSGPPFEASVHLSELSEKSESPPVSPVAPKSLPDSGSVEFMGFHLEKVEATQTGHKTEGGGTLKQVGIGTSRKIKGVISKDANGYERIHKNLKEAVHFIKTYHGEPTDNKDVE